MILCKIKTLYINQHSSVEHKSSKMRLGNRRKTFNIKRFRCKEKNDATWFSCKNI